MSDNPALGDRAVCRSCGAPIEYIGPAWRHVGAVQPRHIAEPGGESAAMEAGPTLNALIAVRVMGQRRADDCGLGDATCPGRYEPMIGRWPCLPPYSTDIEAAWFVVERLRERFRCGVDVSAVMPLFSVRNGSRHAYMCRVYGGDLGYSRPDLREDTPGATPALVICLAALKAEEASRE